MSTTGEKTMYYCKRYGFFCAGANEWGECNTTACWNSNTGRIVIEEETSKHVKVTDYIKREDVYDQLDRWARDLNNPQVYQRDDARCVIDGIPSADVAPVVRCKDCTYYCPLDDSRPYDCLRSGMLCVRKDDFCSCGKERR